MTTHHPGVRVNITSRSRSSTRTGPSGTPRRASWRKRSRRPRRPVLLALTLALAAITVVVGVPPAWASGAVWPLRGAVVRGFDPPEVAWGAGHRGVDVAGAVGAAVRAPRDGVISFAGAVAGRPVLVVDHGETRTTLEPVTAAVAVGRRVSAGEVIGHLSAGHACAAEACLHWGLKRGEEYLDPLVSVSDGVRLLPDSAAGEVKKRADQRRAAAAALAAMGALAGAGFEGGAGVLAVPTRGRITSVFGPRFHPIFKEWRTHQGVDLSAPCGTPIHAAGDGTVIHVGFDSSGGWRLIIAHGTIGGVDLQSVYLHAQGYRVRVGERVGRGQLVGTVGSTGWSTGCHLHFSTKANGRHVDPQKWW
ncbi:MAG: peptidoglycan DD-metalloendopeptidase family protein [Propioniciclava sp.]|uniref:M23 family metallopeptidase n=1 Tax=Propioniciclava sp. TaxID=2038686 RepID=UPI0039E6BC14